LITLTLSAGILTPQKAEALDSEEQTFLTQINNYRARNGLGPCRHFDRQSSQAIHTTYLVERAAIQPRWAQSDPVRPRARRYATEARSLAPDDP
jgi:hypothetical protein